VKPQVEDACNITAQSAKLQLGFFRPPWNPSLPVSDREYLAFTVPDDNWKQMI